jgi:hypothetical protein
MQIHAAALLRHDRNRRIALVAAAIAIAISLIALLVMQALGSPTGSPIDASAVGSSTAAASSTSTTAWTLAPARDVSATVTAPKSIQTSSPYVPQTEPALTASTTTCYATFSGDATGARDVTSSLTAFLKRYNGRSVCLKYHGVYRVDGIVRLDTLSGLRLDGRGSTLKQVATSTAGSNRRIFYILRGSNLVIGNMILRGKNPDFTRWVSGRQNEHGIWIDGGTSIRIHHVTIRDMYGDGIDINFKDGAVAPPAGITIDHDNIARVGRNGIGITAGHSINITYTSIADTGLHGVDFEPDYLAAKIYAITLQHSKILRVGRGHIDTSYAFAANGKIGNISGIRVLYNTGDHFNVTIQAKPGYIHRNVVFTGNRSSYSANAYFTRIIGLTFSSNYHITRHLSSVQ